MEKKFNLKELYQVLLLIENESNVDALELRYEDLSQCSSAYDWAVECDNYGVFSETPSDIIFKSLAQGVESGEFEAVFLELYDLIDSES